MSSADTANKRQRQDDSPPKQALKKTKDKAKTINEGTECFICENIIKIESETCVGE